jgi:glutaredoxin
MEPVRVTVITYAPTVFRHCQHCEVAFEGLGFGERIHRSEAKDALPDDLSLEYQQVSDWVHGLLERHRRGVEIAVVDAASIEGVLRSLRHGVRRFPAVIIDGVRRQVASDDLGDLDADIDTAVASRLEGGRIPTS